MDPSEVLAYLNQLGYRNISALQLKEFIKDLKKLIKYEQKIANSIGNTKISEITNNTQDSNQNPEIHSDIRDVFDLLYSRSTVSSHGKKVVPSTKQISVHITKKAQKTRHTHCTHIDKNNKPESRQSSDVSPNTCSNVELVEAESSTTITKPESNAVEDTKKRPLSCENVNSVNSTTKTVKNTRVRPESSKQVNRRDPVALFQYYQSEWKKQKFPGQEIHTDLRWAIREKLLAGCPVDIPMTNKTSCRKVVLSSDPALR